MFDFLDEILNELKDIPGLNFLKSLQAGLRLKSSRLRKQAQILKNRRNDLTKGASKLRRMAKTSKGSKRRDN